MALPMVMNILLLGFLALFAGQMSILAIREINAEMDDIQQLSQEQQAMLQEIRKGKKCEVNCEREIRNGKSIFTICRDVFPINHVEYNKSANEQIGPFPVPRFPLHKKCSATNPSSSMPPSKLTITIGFPFSGNVACHSGFDICYASAFEGSTKMDLWEILELKNAGNDVAEKCNKNDNNGGIKWHGFRIVRKVEEENENGAKRLIITDSMEFSYRKKKRIRLNKGEFFHQLILTEIGLEVLTSSRNIYILEDGRIYDPEKDTNFGKRVDLANVDISSTQKIFYEFNHNASLWTIPFDMAIIDPSKYNVPIYGIPPADAKNLKISAMKAVYSAEECNIRPTFEIDDIIFKWEKVAPVVLNFTLLNGTESAFYYIKYGYLNFEKSVFNDGKILKKISYEIWKNLELSNILKEKKFDFSSLTGYEMGYHQISNEEYQNGVMVLKAKSFNTEIIYGWAEFDSAMAKANDNLAPDEFNWTNDFYLLNGCKHTTINLLSNLDKTRTHRALGKTESAEYNVEFVVGLSSNVAGFILTKEDVAFLELFHESIQNKEFDGQKILDDSHVFKLLKSLNLNAKFRQLNEDLMKTIIGDSSAPWELLEGEFGLFQEIYQCPNFRVNLPQVSGKIKFTFEDRNGEISTDFIGFSSKNVAINFIDSYTILNPMGKLECILNDVFNKNGRDIYYRGSGKCVI